MGHFAIKAFLSTLSSLDLSQEDVTTMPLKKKYEFK